MKTCKKMTSDDKDIRKLNHALQRYVQRTDIRAKMKKVGPHVAESEMESGRIKMTIDPDTAPRLQSYIHEILHWYYEKNTEGVPYSIHELWIQATETQLWSFISKDKRRVSWWRKTCRR
jgi:poly(3-hydroxyalkanoate) synthetase